MESITIQNTKKSDDSDKRVDSREETSLTTYFD